MQEWIAAHQSAIWWLATFSLATFFAGIVLGPWWVVRIPADYFMSRGHRRAHRNETRSGARVRWILLRNLLGLTLIVAGLFLLVLPGQGLLTMLAGVMLTDFPGKYGLARWLVSRPPVRDSVNWLRRRAGRTALILE